MPSSPALAARPLLVLLLPRPLERFILRDQVADLLTAPGAVAVEPARIPYGALGRLPGAVAPAVAHRQAKRMRLPGVPRAVVVFHPFQYPLADALLDRNPDAELWYSRWDRYESAYDASPRDRERLRVLHAAAAERAALTFTVSDALTALERDAGRSAITVPTSADAFPAPDPAETVVAVNLGHLGRRTDWALLRAVVEGMPELVLLLIGAWHEDESGTDPDFRACRTAANIVWLGHRSDAEAARLILCADVGIVPFERSEFNATGLAQRVLKYARLGRRAIAPPGVALAPWERAAVVADGAAEWIAALRAEAGRRTSPDIGLRAWALAQTARESNRPLWERLELLGIESGRLGSERAGSVG